MRPRIVQVTRIIFYLFFTILTTDIEEEYPSGQYIPDLPFPIVQAEITACSTYAVVCRLKTSARYTLTSNGGSFNIPDYPSVIVTIPKKAVASKAKIPLQMKVGIILCTFRDSCFSCSSEFETF